MRSHRMRYSAVIRMYNGSIMSFLIHEEEANRGRHNNTRVGVPPPPPQQQQQQQRRRRIIRSTSQHQQHQPPPQRRRGRGRPQQHSTTKHAHATNAGSTPRPQATSVSLPPRTLVRLRTTTTTSCHLDHHHKTRNTQDFDEDADDVHRRSLRVNLRPDRGTEPRRDSRGGSRIIITIARRRMRNGTLGCMMPGVSRSSSMTLAPRRRRQRQ